MRQVVNRVRPSVRHKHMQAAAETPVELELQRVVGRTGVVVHNDSTESSICRAKNPSNEATAQSANVSSRKCLLPERLLYRSVPLPRVGGLVARGGAERRPESKRLEIRSGRRATGRRS